MNQTQKSILLIIGACFLWGIDLLVRYPLVQKLGFVHLTFLETFLGLIFVIPWKLKVEKKLIHSKLPLRDWAMLIFLGGMGMTVAGFFSDLSLSTSTPAIFSIVQILQPLYVVIASRWILGEKVDSLYFYGGAWVLLSTLMIYSQDFMSYKELGVDIDPKSLWMAFLAMLIWGSCTFVSKILLKKYTPLTIVYYRLIFAFIFSLVFLITKSSYLIEIIRMLTISDFLRLFFMSGIAGCLSMVLYYSGVSHLEAGKVSFLELSYPNFGIMLWSFFSFEKASLLRSFGVLFYLSFILLLLTNFKTRKN